MENNLTSTLVQNFLEQLIAKSEPEFKDLLTGIRDYFELYNKLSKGQRRALHRAAGALRIPYPSLAIKPFAVDAVDEETTLAQLEETENSKAEQKSSEEPLKLFLRKIGEAFHQYANDLETK